VVRSGGSDDQAGAAEESCASNSSLVISASSCRPSGDPVSPFAAGCHGLVSPDSDVLTLIASSARADGGPGRRCPLPLDVKAPADRGADAWVGESGLFGRAVWLPDPPWPDGIELGPESAPPPEETGGEAWKLAMRRGGGLGSGAAACVATGCTTATFAWGAGSGAGGAAVTCEATLVAILVAGASCGAAGADALTWAIVRATMVWAGALAA
jgi:hypothetical protein